MKHLSVLCAGASIKNRSLSSLVILDHGVKVRSRNLFGLSYGVSLPQNLTPMERGVAHRRRTTAITWGFVRWVAWPPAYWGKDILPSSVRGTGTTVEFGECWRTVVGQAAFSQKILEALLLVWAILMWIFLNTRVRTSETYFLECQGIS